MLSADDFFTTHRYEGEIYKTVNLQDKLIANYCPDETAVKQEQKKIEKELTDLQEHVWGRDSAYYARLKADSLAAAEADSIAAAGKAARTARRTASPSRRTASARTTRVKSSSSASSGSAKTPKQSKTKSTKTKATKPKSSSGSGLSVRRQRH